MPLDGCTNETIDKYYSSSERVHEAYCKSKNTPYDPMNACSTAEGCIYLNDECQLNSGKTLASAYINGGFGFGKLCLSKEFTRLILLILFPPLYIFVNEQETGFKNKMTILKSFVYTCLFYFPGLIHALMYKHRR